MDAYQMEAEPKFKYFDYTLQKHHFHYFRPSGNSCKHVL